MKVCYVVVKKNQMLEINQQKITATIFAIMTVLTSTSDSIATRAIMLSMSNIDVKALTKAVIQTRYPLRKSVKMTNL